MNLFFLKVAFSSFFLLIFGLKSMKFYYILAKLFSFELKKKKNKKQKKTKQNKELTLDIRNMSPKNAIKMIKYSKVLFSPHWFYSFHSILFGPIWSILSTLVLFGLLWSYSVNSIHFDSICSYSVHIGPIHIILSISIL